MSTTKEMIQAIRGDTLVGRGTCSSVDECLEDSALEEYLRNEGVQTIEGAVKWARDYEGLHLEQGLNCRWGEDDDPQLLAYQQYQQRLRDEG